MDLTGRELDGKRVLVTGGTGSLGQVLVRRMLSGKHGTPDKIIVFSRDEAKQHYMRLDFQNRRNATDEVIYRNFRECLDFRIGDVRDYHSVVAALRGADVVVGAAALKQVPTCEYFPWEAVRTNIEGAENIVRAIWEFDFSVEAVIGVSTDKACKPVNVMGMTKAIQERVYVQGNMRRPDTRFVCVRYGNVLASRGSVIPLFMDQIAAGGPVTITTTDMTRFLLTLEDAVDTIVAALRSAAPGETYIPRAPSAMITDVARILIGGRDVDIEVTGIRPGEKIHEILISAEEAYRTVYGSDGFYALRPMLPEVGGDESPDPVLTGEFSSADHLMSASELATYLAQRVPELADASYLGA
jgi:FlaA1/EpsC-like NDP-sugar epimerase